MATHFKAPDEETMAQVKALYKQKLELAREKAAVARERRQELSSVVQVTAGKDLIATSHGSADIHMRADGLVYFAKDPAITYRLAGFEWGGPQYQTVVHTKTKGKSKETTRRKGHLFGAAVGTVLLPGVGTVVGGMAGTGKKKSHGKTQSDSVSYGEQVEVDSPAQLMLERVEDGARLCVSLACRAESGNAIRNMLLSAGVLPGTAE